VTVPDARPHGPPRTAPGAALGGGEIDRAAFGPARMGEALGAPLGVLDGGGRAPAPVPSIPTAAAQRPGRGAVTSGGDVFWIRAPRRAEARRRQAR
jgi:hypothetical protein